LINRAHERLRRQLYGNYRSLRHVGHQSLAKPHLKSPQSESIRAFVALVPDAHEPVEVVLDQAKQG
jgi:hypothetical protein